MTRLRAAFFDMDRTLVRVNTGTQYMRWRYRRGEADLRDVARFARWIARYSLGLLEPEEITKLALSALQGVDEASFRADMDDWYAAWVRPHIAQRAREEVARRRHLGDELVVLTASTPYAAGPLARDLGIPHVLSTTLEVRDGQFTGQTEVLCYGAGKVPVARAWAEARGIALEDCCFYTDSVSDRAMLEAVGSPIVVNPDLRLTWLARRKRWPIERWT